METALALQYRRGRKRLQLIVLPYSLNLSVSALMRLTRVDDPPAYDKAWRVIGIADQPFILHIEDMDPFETDASMMQIMGSPWFKSEQRVTEVKRVIQLDPFDVVDIRMNRVPRGVLLPLSEEISDWA